MVRGGRRVSGLVGAIQFLTRVPIRTASAVAHERCIPWFPIVGLLIGALVGGVAVGLGELVPSSVAAAFAVVTGLLLTGAFHEDGLADVADAFGGGVTRERRFEILTDSRHGTYGVAALCSSVVLRVVSAAAIGSSAALFGGFVAAHAVGRGAAVVAMGVAPAASDAGLGAEHVRRLRPLGSSIGVFVALAVCALLLGWWLGPIVAIAIAGGGVTVWLAMRKIGGLVGDVLGAIEQVVECLVLIVVSGLASRHGVWWA
jgi:adenosylcobinamide-GDP ribazoletransferase